MDVSGWLSLGTQFSDAINGQWRLMALKVPEAWTQCRTGIVFTTPVGFSERDTHLVLQLTYKETRI